VGDVLFTYYLWTIDILPSLRNRKVAEALMHAANSPVIDLMISKRGFARVL